MTCTTEKKEKQRRGTYREDLPCMLKIEEEKKKTPALFWLVWVVV